MTNITVKYSEEDYKPYHIKVESGSIIGREEKVEFNMEGGTAVVRRADTNGTFLKEAFEHVKELPFVQAVEMSDSE